MTTFRKHFGIPESATIDFLDIPLDGDTEIFIDPFLIANNRGTKIFDDTYNQLKSFFVKLNRDFIVPNDSILGLRFLDNLHEPNEYHLGYSGTNRGAGISDTRAQTIFGALRNNRFARAGISITNEAHNVLLLVSGIGQDIMSDTIANVCRNIFAEFTTKQCIKHDITTDTFRRSYFNLHTGLWDTKDFELPSYNGKPIILLPLDGLSHTRSYVNHYNYFVAGNFIGKDIIDGKIIVTNTGSYIKKLSDGAVRVIVKNIYKAYRKPKAELIQFVLEYQGSLEDFLDYAKEHYPSVNFNQ